MNPYPISNSRLAAFKRSPKHLVHYLTQKSEPTPAMLFGSAFHAYLLQPEKFDSLYAVAPQVDRRTKEGKAIFDEFHFMVTDANMDIITHQDMEKIKEMTDSVMSDPIAGELIRSATSREVDRNWTNSVHEIPMRGIIDGIGNGFMFDVKTCQDAQPQKFARDAFYSDYHRQAAIYLDSQDDDSTEFYFIAIEKDRPYGVSVHRLSEHLKEIGKKQYLDAIIEYRSWVDAGLIAAGYDYWHYSGIHELEAPAYIK